MDADTIRNLIEPAIISLTALAPVGQTMLEKIGESMADKVGEDLVEQGKRFRHLIHRRFSEEPAESYITPKVLDDFIENPELYRPALEKALSDLLQQDSTFLQQFSQIVGPVQEIIVGKRGKAIANELRSNVLTSHQIIQVEEEGTAEKNILQATIDNAPQTPQPFIKRIFDAFKRNPRR